MTDDERDAVLDSWRRVMGSPLDDFEYAVVEDTIDGVEPSLCPQGVWIIDANGDTDGITVPWEDVVERTIELLGDNRHLIDLFDANDDKLKIAAALNRAAQRILDSMVFDTRGLLIEGES